MYIDWMIKLDLFLDDKHGLIHLSRCLNKKHIKRSENPSNCLLIVPSFFLLCRLFVGFERETETLPLLPPARNNCICVTFNKTSVGGGQ